MPEPGEQAISPEALGRTKLLSRHLSLLTLRRGWMLPAAVLLSIFVVAHADMF